MANRISRVVTRTGDEGSTGLADGRRVSKCHPRIVAMGEVDELNCQLGVLLCLPMDEAMRVPLARLQHRLFDLGGQLAMPDAQLIGADAVAWLDQLLDGWNTALPPLKEFVLPGGNAAGAQAHLTRAVARRAERALWALHAEETLPEPLLQFANRLSDLLFVAARRLVRDQGAQEVGWQRD